MPIHFDPISHKNINELLQNKTISQAELDSIINNPEQGYIGQWTGGNLTGAPVYHIEYEDTTPVMLLWTYNRQTQTIQFLGLYYRHRNNNNNNNNN